MLVLFLLALQYINLIQYAFAVSKYSDQFNEIKQLVVLLDQYDEYDVVDSKKEKAISTSASVFNTDWWKYTLLSTSYSQRFIDDAITGTRAVIYEKYKRERDQCIEHLPLISDRGEMWTRSIADQYIFPIIDTIFIKAIVFGLNDAKKTFAKKCNIDANTVQLQPITYSAEKHNIQETNVFSMWLMNPYAVGTHRLAHGRSYKDAVIQSYLSTPTKSVPKKPSALVYGLQKTAYESAFSMGRQDFQSDLDEKKQLFREEFQKLTEPIYKMKVFTHRPKRGTVEKALKRFEDGSVTAMDFYGNLGFDLVREGFMHQFKERKDPKHIKLKRKMRILHK